MKLIKTSLIFHVALSLIFHLMFQKNAETAEIITTIKPVYSLVKAIVVDKIAIELLVEGNQSPHDYQIKPSQIKKQSKAKVLFYISPKFERFLVAATNNFNGHLMALADVEGLELLAKREGGAWEYYDSDNDREIQGYHDKQLDPHIWLSPVNAQKLSLAIAKKLSRLYPDHRRHFLENAKKLNKQIDDADKKIARQLKSVQKKPFIVFHDAYQYFEKHYDLKGVGSITLEPNQSVSIKRVGEIRDKIKAQNVTCVFREPQFSGKLVKTVTDGTKAKIIELDPLGTLLDKNDSFYIKLLFSLKNNFSACLR